VDIILDENQQNGLAITFEALSPKTQNPTGAGFCCGIAVKQLS